LITRERILIACEEVGLEHLTVQAVADRLGVTRAAVYNHVESSDGLRRLAAAATVDTFDFDDTESGDWESWLRDFAGALRAWYLTNAPAGPYIPATEITAVGVIPALEQVLDVLARAGFGDDAAVRGLEFVLGVVWVNTHDQLLAQAQPDGIHPQQAQMLSEGTDLHLYPRMQRAMERDSIYGAFDARFEFELGGVLNTLRSELSDGEDDDS
jgi:AcrR family transcriptional regulator